MSVNHHRPAVNLLRPVRTRADGQRGERVTRTDPIFGMYAFCPRTRNDGSVARPAKKLGVDRDFDADDAPQLRLDIGLGRIVDRPGMCALCFLMVREFVDRAMEPRGIGIDPRNAARLDHGVVPRRHDLARLLLRLVPGGRHVGIDALEDGEGGLTGRERQVLELIVAGRLRMNGMPLARSPSGPVETSNPNGWDSMRPCWTSMRSSR